VILPVPAQPSKLFAFVNASPNLSAVLASAMGVVGIAVHNWGDGPDTRASIARGEADAFVSHHHRPALCFDCSTTSRMALTTAAACLGRSRMDMCVALVIVRWMPRLDNAASPR
jgi:hypothetical protein